MKKTFDTVNWHYMQQVLKHMNFGPIYTNYIRTIYNLIESCCMNNGYITHFFKPSRGTRQGCPISALLFILIVETLATKVRTDKSINGININNRYIIISQLVDGTTLFRNDEDSLKNVEPRAPLKEG